MFTFNVDLGQIIIVSAMGIIGYFVKRTIDRLEERMDKHETIIFKMAGNIQRIMGKIGLMSSE